MKNKTLVSIVSEQTIPNIELIQEFKDEINDYLFIITDKTTKEGQLDWILKSAMISKDTIKTIKINPFDPREIEQTLRDYDFSDENEYLVNVTGGTKLSTVIINDFFKNLGAKTYYLTGHKKQFIKLFPAFGTRIYYLKKKILLNQYLYAYGLTIKNRGRILKSSKYTKDFLKLYFESDFKFTKPILKELQLKRNTKNPISTSLISDCDKLLKYFKFETEEENILNKKEIQYLTGDWLEEYTYSRIKEEFGLSNDEIGIGYVISKSEVRNEFDVLFVYNNKIHTIECKTGIEYHQIMPNGKTKSRNLLSATLYKSDSLKNLFGLFVNTSVLTLTQLRSENNEYIEKYKDHIDRARINRIKIISKKDIQNKTAFEELLKIK